MSVESFDFADCRNNFYFSLTDEETVIAAPRRMEISFAVTVSRVIISLSKQIANGIKLENVAGSR